MHSDYLSPAIRQLRDQQVRFAPRDRKLEQTDLAEGLLGELSPSRSYTYEYLCYRITKFRPDSHLDVKMSGCEARHDLLLLVEDLSDSANVPADAAGEPVLTVEELSREFKVSMKTVSRWRRQGLVSRRFIFDGRKRVGFLRSSVDRFVERNRERVRRGARFSQLSEEERQTIIIRARRLAEAGLSPADVTKRLATMTGRSVETIRYTLKQFDRDHPGLELFPDSSGPFREELKAKIYEQFHRGESAEALAKRFCRTKTSIYRIVAEVRAKRIMELPLDYVPNEQFERIRPGPEENVILGPAPLGEDVGRRARLPSGLPSDLASLCEVPLLTRAQEVHLFRKMNYLKYKASKLREQLDLSRPKTAVMDQIDMLYDEATATKDEIVAANMRLVVSIARRHASRTEDIRELISDGKKSLIRAVRKFDFGRGNKFSTYATRAIMTGYGCGTDDGRADVLSQNRPHHGQQSLEPPASLECLGLPSNWNELRDREQQIIAMRFSLLGNERMTLKQIGEKLGITKERVRQIETQALSKLRRRFVQPSD